MKRSLKNIICIFIILAMATFTFFTMNYAKEHENTNQNQMSEQNNNQNNQSSNEMPQMPGNSSGNSNDNNSNDNNSNNNSNSQQGNPPSGNETPPAKPGENNSNTNSNDNNSSSDKNSSSSDNNQNSNNNSNNQTPPSGGNAPQMPSDMNQSSSDNNLSTIYYCLFLGQGLIIGLIIIYLIMSRLNKKTIKETFKNSDKIIILVMSTMLFTGAFTLGSVLLTENCFIKNNQTTNTTSNNSNATYTATKEITESTTIKKGTYKSTNEDENAISISGDIKAKLSNIKVTKTGDSDGGDNTSFYGTNSGIIAKDGANVTLDNITVNTNATGANGVFSYGGSATTNNSSSDGTTVTIKNSTITTSKDNSGGIMTTGGGTMNATNLTINTAGTSSAAIRTDRGGGTVNVNKGTYTTTGKGSPAIYSTAKITVKNAKLVSKASEGIVIEGKNSVSLYNTTLTDTNNQLNGQSTTYKNIFLYQSMSGDASEGSSTFTAKKSTITTNKGDTFYITNTSAVINLENNTITNNDSTGNFLRAKSDSWGTEGSNGGDVTLNLTNQKAVGNIVIDEVSTLEMNLTNGSYYEGSINTKNEAKSIKLVLDKSSKIKLTGDTYVTSLKNADATNSNIDFNGYKLYVNNKAIN